MAKFSGLVLRVFLSVSKDSSVGIPFSDGRRVGADGLLCDRQNFGAETSGETLFSRGEARVGNCVGESFILQDGRGVGPLSKGTDSANNGISVEKSGLFQGLD